MNSNEPRHASSSSKVSPNNKLLSVSKSHSLSEIRKGEHEQAAAAVSDTSMEDLLKDLVVMTENILDDSGWPEIVFHLVLVSHHWSASIAVLLSLRCLLRSSILLIWWMIWSVIIAQGLCRYTYSLITSVLKIHITVLYNNIFVLDNLFLYPIRIQVHADSALQSFVVCTDRIIVSV